MIHVCKAAYIEGRVTFLGLANKESQLRNTCCAGIDLISVTARGSVPLIATDTADPGSRFLNVWGCSGTGYDFPQVVCGHTVILSKDIPSAWSLYLYPSCGLVRKLKEGLYT